MRNELAIYQNSLLSNIRKLKERLESLEIFERALYWNTQSDKQDQGEPLRAFYDIDLDIEKLSQIIAEMRAVHTKTEDNLTKPKAETTACTEAKHTEEATNCDTPPRDWKEIITLLFDMSDTTKKDKAEAERYRKTAEVLQCLNENNGSEREKEAFFKYFEPIYQLYLQMDDKFKQALAKDAQNERARRAKIAEWERLPFYRRKSDSILCLENQNVESNKPFAFSCLLDTLSVMPELIELDLLDTSKQRLAEICKLYLAFVDEQFSILTKEIEMEAEGGKQ
ncbi:hypothetical protein NUS45_06645 [Glaesserella parasuis]|nr:hypothetical protein [Glaesserella parasuis]MCT8813349.1 hypothetical protein [Glaesserella parasuis]MCT8829510.1 hypothetical protein [Glaesserella parasuis]MCT8829523.1 hypothetical protein [Glaesserella parasuis]MCT8834046.1 hypothetical protein [Glaesserella parasuis]